MEAAISADGLVKRYGRTAVVEDVTFRVESGEVVGFLGPNGAGKTTTMRMLAGLIQPTDGHCSILGERVRGPSLRRVGTMIEEPSFYPYMTGRGNLRHASLLHGGVPERRVDEVLDFVGILDAGNKRVKAYSQGMRQRLGLARSLLWEPDVLILDEPTNGLDPEGIAEFRELLSEVGERGVTVLISSHILAEIEKLVQRVLVIDGGRLRYGGSLQGLMRRIDEQRVSYLLRMSNPEALAPALERLGIAGEQLEGDSARVWVADAESDDLIAALVGEGLRLVEARREADSLEGAYLRLLHDREAA